MNGREADIVERLRESVRAEYEQTEERDQAAYMLGHIALGDVRIEAADLIERLSQENEGLRTALTKLRLTARLLLQNAEGCAINHYGEDFQLFGPPGWIVDCEAVIVEAEAAIPSALPLSEEGIPLSEEGMK
jgi:hypothetical protein